MLARVLTSRLPFLLALLLSSPALAESASLWLRSPTSGLDIPGTSVALEDGPAAGVVNPAGLSMQRGFGARYLHEESVGDGRLLGRDGDGLYLGTPLFGLFGLGLSFEWIQQPDDFSDHRRTTWSLALGDEVLSIGASAHVFTHGVLDDETSWDAGLLFRPRRYLSVGFVARDLDSPRIGDTRLSRRYVLGVGLRPLGDWLTVAVDGGVLGAENKDIDHGFDAMALGYTARVRPVGGVTFYGGYTHRLDGGADVVQVGLRLDHDFLGIEGAPLVRTSGGEVGWIAGAELRTYSEGRVRPAPGARMVRVRLDEALASPRGLNLFPAQARDPFVDTIEGLAALGRDRSVDGVVVEIRGGLPIGLGRAWDVRRALLDLKSRGKKVVAYVHGADDTAYLVASAADHIVASPSAAFFVNGFAARADFFEDTLAWLGVKMEVVRVGRYKTAPEALTRSSISDAQREVMHSLLQDIFEGYVSELAASRNLAEDAVRDVLRIGIRSSESARSAGLIDAIAYEDELREQVEAWTGGRIKMEQRLLRPTAWTHWSAPPVIAVIPIDGTIVAGRSGGMGLVQSTGAQSVVRSLEAASMDPSVRAILLRIDSGGGDAGGSEEIWRAVRQARRNKPVIVAMGDAAASGGYYAAVAGDRIFASPGTYTGSIGIFWLKPNLREMLTKLKIGTYEVSEGEQAEILSFREGWTERETEAIQTYVDEFYREFIENVATDRDLGLEDVDAVGQGRVWTGSQALARGLVDDLGGLPAALRTVRESAGLDPEAVVEFRVYAQTPSLFSAEGISQAARPSWEEPVRGLLREAVPIPILLWNGTGLWALAPFAWRTH